MATVAAPSSGETYEGGCHCGYIKFSVTLSPPLSESKTMQCNCSICRHNGYLLVYPNREAVKWHGDSLARCAKYEFNTKRKPHLFCPKCGSSLGLDFNGTNLPKWDGYGINARALYNVNLDELQYRNGNGLETEKPAVSLVGRTHVEDGEKDE